MATADSGDWVFFVREKREEDNEGRIRRKLNSILRR